MYWENLLKDDIRAPLDMKNVSLHVVLFSKVGNCYCRSPSVWLSDRFRFTFLSRNLFLRKIYYRICKHTQNAKHCCSLKQANYVEENDIVIN